MGRLRWRIHADRQAEQAIKMFPQVGRRSNINIRGSENYLHKLLICSKVFKPGNLECRGYMESLIKTGT